MRKDILIRRGYLIEGSVREIGVTDLQSKYYAAKLLNQFGVLVDRPLAVQPEHVKQISQFFGVNIPKSFYINPQDTKYFTCDELFLEQLVSYMSIELVTGVRSSDEESFDRIELFKKVLPDYKEGDDVVFRNYRIISEIEANSILKEVAENLASYTRKWNETESNEFSWLYENSYVDKDLRLASRDNAIDMFNKFIDAQFARSLDRKDVVKLSIEMVGEKKNFKYTDEQKTKLKVLMRYCRYCPMTKKQAKYFNTIARHLNMSIKAVDNSDSPYKLAKRYMDSGHVVLAAEVFAKNGSLLERNLMWLLSRATLDEAQKIISMIKIKNPIVSLQFIMGLLNESNDRVFTFYKNRKIKHHVETTYEKTWRKSVLSPGMKKYLKSMILAKIDDFYRSLPSIGKVFIDEGFDRLSIPYNTSASGTGIDVLPVGSRLPITQDYIRTFCYWRNAFDIDTSVSFIHESGSIQALYWGNYSSKLFGDSALSSGDDRSANGSEYQDFKISELRERGFKYAVYTLNGFGSSLSAGEIYCGYQNKSDINTKAWDAKNMAIKLKVHGNSRAYIGFIIDLVTNEVIIINQMLESDSRVVNGQMLEPFNMYFNPEYVEIFNVKHLASLRGEVVDSPEDADYVFSNSYVKSDSAPDNQVIVKSSDIEKIIKLLR